MKEVSLKDTFFRVRRKDWGYMNGKMGANIAVSGQTIKLME